MHDHGKRGRKTLSLTGDDDVTGYGRMGIWWTHHSHSRPTSQRFVTDHLNGKVGYGTALVRTDGVNGYCCWSGVVPLELLDASFVGAALGSSLHQGIHQGLVGGQVGGTFSQKRKGLREAMEGSVDLNNLVGR
jgi:hypothetical protein